MWCCNTHITTSTDNSQNMVTGHQCTAVFILLFFIQDWRMPPPLIVNFADSPWIDPQVWNKQQKPDFFYTKNEEHKLISGAKWKSKCLQLLFFKPCNGQCHLLKVVNIEKSFSYPGCFSSNFNKEPGISSQWRTNQVWKMCGQTEYLMLSPRNTNWLPVEHGI